MVLRKLNFDDWLLYYRYMSAGIDVDAIEYAQSKYEHLDCVADVYAFQIIWGSETILKKLGYTLDEFSTIGIRDLLDVDSSDFMKIAITQFTGKPNHKNLKTKSGEIIPATAEIHTFMHDNSPYVAVVNVVFEESGEE